jgi:hypothetical protein
MGYTTEFVGSFSVTPRLNPKIREFLVKLNNTRRMKRTVDPKYGVDGEFYVEDDENNVIDHNTPPSTQPGLWCQWEPNEDGTEIRWDGGEKFYNYVEWLEYIIKNVLVTHGYTVNGHVKWTGESEDDVGTITVENNVVTTNPEHEKPVVVTPFDTINCIKYVVSTMDANNHKELRTKISTLEAMLSHLYKAVA